MSSKIDEKQIDELLTRGVGDFIDPDGAFRKKLKENPEKIIIKFGVDPTRPDLHLGHAVVLRKLRKFQDLGCKVIFLVGDYTGQIGDPTGKSRVRPEIQINEIFANMQTYLDQVKKILNTDSKVFSWIRNSDWFTDVSDIGLGVTTPEIEVIVSGEKRLYPNNIIGKAQILMDTRMQITHLHKEGIETISTSRILGTLRHLTHSRLIARDMFQDRIKKGEELYMHEMLYPVLQGLDSAALTKIYGCCDLEVGGTDQTFNMLIGRDVMKMYNQIPEQAVLSFALLEGTDGKEKMSKSLDNYIGVTEKPIDMFRKIMTIPDSVIENYFFLCTDVALEEIKQLKKLENPKDAKLRLGFEIVKIYYSENIALEAQKEWEGTVSRGGVPEDIEEISISSGTKLKNFLVENKIVESNSEFTRLLSAGAIKNAETDEKINSDMEITSTQTLRVGKRRFVKIIVR